MSSSNQTIQDWSYELSFDNISWRVWVGTLTTIIPATIVVVLRFVARYVSRAGFWWDDYSIVISLVCTYNARMSPLIDRANNRLDSY